MAELMVSYLITSPNASPRGRRFHDDGQVDDYQVSKMVKAADGTYRDEPVTPGWYPMIRLSAADLKAVQQAVAASGAADMPADIQGDSKRSTANRKAEWQIQSGGSLKTITVSHWPAEGETGQALVELSSVLGDIVSKAVAAQ